MTDVESKKTCLEEIDESISNIRWVLDKCQESVAEQIDENLDIIKTFVDVLSGKIN